MAAFRSWPARLSKKAWGKEFPQTPFFLFYLWAPVEGSHQKIKNKRMGVWGKFFSPGLPQGRDRYERHF